MNFSRRGPLYTKLSQIFCQWLQLPDLKVCDALPSTRSKKMHILHHLQCAENLFYLHKSTFITTIYGQNVIKLKQNVLNNLFQYFSNLFHLSLGQCQFHLRMLSKHLKARSFLLMYDIFHKLLYLFLRKEAFIKPEHFCY